MGAEEFVWRLHLLKDALFGLYFHWGWRGEQVQLTAVSVNWRCSKPSLRYDDRNSFPGPASKRGSQRDGIKDEGLESWEKVCVFCVLVAQSCHLFEILWTGAHQTPLSMEFPGKNTWVGCHAFLQGIFLTQGSNPGILHWQVDSLLFEPPGKPGEQGTNCLRYSGSLLRIG